MPKKRFEISRLLSGHYALRVFPPAGDETEHMLMPVVGRTLGNYPTEAEAFLMVGRHISGQEPYEVVLVR